MASITKNDFRFIVGDLILSNLTEQNSLYCFLGKTTDWETALTPPTPTNSDEEFFETFNEMIVHKKINSTDIVFAAPRNNWLSGTVYDYFYHYNQLETGVDGATSLEESNYYVLTDEMNVYKCIDNAGGSASTEKPTGTSVNTFETVDGYIWKFMFSISPADSNRFLTPLFMPVRYKTEDDGSNQYLVQQSAVPGTIEKIKIISGGDSYSTPTITINGDGTGATATATVVDGVITEVTITDPGQDYTWATISISEEGSPLASLKAVISPVGGHGSNAVEELGAHYIIVYSKFNPSEEKTPTNSGYHQLGLITNPLRTSDGLVADDPILYGCNGLTVTPLSGTFLHDEVISGALSGATGKMVSITDDGTEIRYTQSSLEKQTPFQTGELITGATSGATATSSALIEKEIEDGTGKIIFVENRKKVERSPDQSEDIKIVIEI